jgi:hypothetical protein
VATMVTTRGDDCVRAPVVLREERAERAREKGESERRCQGGCSGPSPYPLSVGACCRVAPSPVRAVAATGEATPRGREKKGRGWASGGLGHGYSDEPAGCTVDL